MPPATSNLPTWADLAAGRRSGHGSDARHEVGAWAMERVRAALGETWPQGWHKRFGILPTFERSGQQFHRSRSWWKPVFAWRASQEPSGSGGSPRSGLAISPGVWRCVRRIRHQLKVGQLRAQQLRDYLIRLARGQSA